MIDLLISHGTIVTMDPQRRIIRDGAMAIQGETIIEVGKTEELKKNHHANTMIEAEGKLVLPGFINTHTHSQTGTTECRGAGIEKPGGLYIRLLPMKELTPAEDRYYLSMTGILGDVRMGVTTEVDQDFGEASTARAVKESGVRARLSQYIYSIDMQAMRSKGYVFSPHIEQRTFKDAMRFNEEWDGKSEGRITCDLTPHAPDSCSPELLNKVREEANRRKRRIAIHLAQSEEEVEQVKLKRGKTPVEYLQDTGILGPDCYAAHCVYVTDKDISILAKTKTGICHSPLSFARRGVTAPLIPWLQARCTVGLALDGYEDMFRYMQIAQIGAAFRKSFSGQGDGITAQKLLELATIDAARVIGMERQIGSLEAGKKADATILNMKQPHLVPSLDPVADIVYFGKGSDVETVIIDGKVVVDNRQVKTVNEQEILSYAQGAGERAWARFYGK